MSNVDFVSNAERVIKTIDEKFAKAAEIIGGMMETNAKKNITETIYSHPSVGYIRTGNLRNSITHMAEEDKNSVTIAVGSAVEYAPYIELGTGKFAEGGGGRQTPWRYQDKDGKWHTTSGIPARPYLRPAVENHIRTYQDVLKQVFDED